MKVKLDEVNIRDPFILRADGKYYLYGTRSETAWSYADGFDCYVSQDLLEWEGPKEIFRRPDGFFADKEYWAPECIFWKGAYYLTATLGSDDVIKGIYILKSEHPDGPFEPYSTRLTPQGRICIDGTVYVDDDHTPWLVYSDSFENGTPSRMDAIRLSDDLMQSVGEPMTLFYASEAPWAVPVPFAEEEFGMKGDVCFTDGPCLKKHTDGRLYMTWSSWGHEYSYAVGTAVSPNGTLAGPWQHDDKALFPKDGGHGMFFEDSRSRLCFTLHYPNEKYREHPVIYPVRIQDGRIILSQGTGSSDSP